MEILEVLEVLEILEILEIMKILEVLEVLEILEIMKILEVLKVLEVLKILEVLEVLEILEIMEVLEITPGRFRHAESESEVENLEILHLEIKENHPKQIYVLIRSSKFDVFEAGNSIPDPRIRF